MMRLARAFPSLTSASLLAVALNYAAPAWAADAAPAQPAVAAAPAIAVSPELLAAAEDYWHYASIARYDLANAAAAKIAAANAEPLAVLKAFEDLVSDKNRRLPQERRVELYERMLAWQRIPQLKDSSAQLLSVFNKAKQTRRADASFIKQNIERLSVNERAFELGVEQLRQSGELAVPLMIAYLQDPAQKAHHVAIRRGLREMGIKALNPLVAATQMKDWTTLGWVISALGDLGYDNAVPYLVRLVHDKSTPAPVRSIAMDSLLRLGVKNPMELNPAQLFVELAEKLYYEKASIAAEPGAATAYMWFWGENGLNKLNVPGAVFNEDMVLRCCETALKLDPSRSDAVSLWLAAAYKREVELPDGAADPIWDKDHLDTHYYATSSGAQHVNAVLARALRDHNAAIAFKAIRSLQEIAGNSNLFASQDRPIIDAMRYPDRQVRFEAAFTVAQTLPQKAFVGEDRVIPIMAEALAQTGKPGVLVIASSQDTVNGLKSKLNATYGVQGGTTADAAVSTATSLPGVDVIVVNEDHAQIERVFSIARDNMRLERAAILVRVNSDVASPYAALAQANPLISVTTAKDDNLAEAIEAARKRAGGLPIDEKVATEYALRSAELLEQLATNRNQVLDLIAAQSAVLSGLNDARPEIILAVGRVLASVDYQQAQTGLLTKVLDEKTPDDMKIQLLNNLANNARLFGNKLQASQSQALTKLVSSAATPEVRSAASEAHGALNLPADQVKGLILQQAK